MTSPSGFTGSHRHLVEEDRIVLTSVGVDIGSSTSHLVFSRLELERADTRYVLVRRDILRESDILLTPFSEDGSIDAEALGHFVDAQYQAAGLKREDIDTGALILTGVALGRRNARAIGDVFAKEAGKFVAVSAGDGLEASLAAQGSGAVQESSKDGIGLNVDIGGGTTKIAVCIDGRVSEVTALDVGGRLVVLNDEGAVVRLEDAGRRLAEAAGIRVGLGDTPTQGDLRILAGVMADRVAEVVAGNELSEDAASLLRVPPLAQRPALDWLIFSGGVSEYVYGREPRSFGDLGPLLAEEIAQKVAALGIPVKPPVAGIRATVIGASQYTVQVSGSTIFVSSEDALPLHNIPVVRPDFQWGDDIAAAQVAQAVRSALIRLDVDDGGSAVALGVHWQGSATFARLQSFCSGVLEALGAHLAHGNPLVLVCDGDVGGLVGLHFREEMKVTSPLVSIDGIELREFDYIDIGELIPTSGAVPVVIKSLVFPTVAG